MQCSTSSSECRESGFGLVEAVIATAIFVILLVISIGPIMSSLRRLDNARMATEAEKLAEARLESIRALDFDDVGLTSGNPSGVIAPSVTVGGAIPWVITTDIQWEGAITGIDAANYKTIDIIVTHPTGLIDPVRFSSIVAPDRLLDSSNKASVTVDLNLMEPVPSYVSPPQVYLVKSDGLGASSGAVFPLAGATATQFKFPLLNPTDSDPGDPNYEMVMRLGPTLDDVASSGWHIDPTALVSGSDTFQLFEAQILDTSLSIYRPAQLEVFIEEVDTGLPINNASLTLYNGTLTETFTTTDGHFFIDTAYGYPLAPDTYDITVQAPGYAPETRSSLTIPSGYPDPLHTETFALEVQVGEPVTFFVRESSYFIPNATVSIPGLPDAVTDGDGQVTIFVPIGNHVATITNTVGFETKTVGFSSSAGTISTNLATPSGYRVVHLFNGGTGDHWGFRERYSSDDYTEITRDSAGNGVFAARYYRYWDVALICADESVGWQQNKYVNGTEWVDAGGNGC